jgi:hypothetical protein
MDIFSRFPIEIKTSPLDRGLPIYLRILFHVFRHINGLIFAATDAFLCHLLCENKIDLKKKVNKFRKHRG